MRKKIRGRFAPTPSGPLHFGSLITALGSYLHSKNRNGEWLVRIDDLDTPRVVPGADTDILNTLEAFGLHWDEKVVYQSQRTNAYLDALTTLSKQDLIYPCYCSRKEIGGSRYLGTCRPGNNREKPALHSSQRCSQRLITEDNVISFNDHIQGLQPQNLQQECGDFVVMRADGISAYHLAVVVDDDWQNITEVIRGADLLGSTPRQIYLQRVLKQQQPEYIHLPVATDETGEKLSKRNAAIRLNENTRQELLFDALKFLGQQPLAELTEATVEEIVQWGLIHWQVKNVPQVTRSLKISRD